MRKLVIIVVACVLAGMPNLARAAPQDVANSVAKEVMSPYCDAVTLHDCASGAAQELRAQILEWAEAGWSKERIINHLTSDDQWGEVIRAAPPPEGTGLLAWVLPGLAVGAGLVTVAFLLRRWSRDKRSTPLPPPVSAAERSRLDQELARLRSET